MLRLWRSDNTPSPSRPSRSSSHQEASNDQNYSLDGTDEKRDPVSGDDVETLSIEQALEHMLQNNESLSKLSTILDSLDTESGVVNASGTYAPSMSFFHPKQDGKAEEQTKELDIYKIRVGELEEELKALRIQTAPGNNAVDTENHDTLENIIQNRDIEIEILKKRLDAAVEENETFKKTVHDKEEQINILRRLDEGRNRWVTGFTRASESVHSYGDKQGEDEMVDATRRISQLRWEIEQYSNRTSQLDANLKAKQKEIDDLRVEKDELTASLDSAQKSLSELKVENEELASLKEALQNKQAEIDSKNNEINSLMEDIMSLNAQNNNSRDEDNLKEMKLLARAKDDRITQLDATVNDLKRKLAVAERDWSDERDELTATIEHQRLELDEKEDMLNSAADRVFDLEDTVDTLQEELHDMELTSQRPEPNSHGVDEVCDACRDTIEELKKEIIDAQQALEEAVEIAENQKHQYQEVINDQDLDLEALRKALKAREENNPDRSYSSIPRPKNRPASVNPRASTSLSSRRMSSDDMGTNGKHMRNQELDLHLQRLAEERDRLEVRLREKDSLLSDKDKDLMQYANMVESLRRDTVGLRNELEDTQDELSRLVAAETQTDRISYSQASETEV
ncbi:hypothetical protein BC943DRAFT_149528 [Umbelopsis sp. AD052]|nr:hypothetical protein BC943DRAFT_149528 [Umbelopsis sp. AD052]